MCPDGHVAEWLRSGLQNRLLRFNSGRGLHINQALSTACGGLRFLVSDSSERPGKAHLARRVSVSLQLRQVIALPVYTLALILSYASDAWVISLR